MNMSHKLALSKHMLHLYVKMDNKKKPNKQTKKMDNIFVCISNYGFLSSF